MISIIIPTLNEEKVIEKTLKNLSEYTGEHEVVLSDGKSKDQTLEIAKKYGAKVIVYEGQKRQTIAMARNMGVQVARGDILLFLDADMFIKDPNMFFGELLEQFEKNPKLRALTVYLKVLPEMATIADRTVYWFFNRMVSMYNNVFRYGASPGEFQMMRLSAFKQVGGFNERLVAGEDFDMFARLSKIGRTKSVSSLSAFHTGRRPHKVGWPKLLWSWFTNWFDATFRGHTTITEWEEIR